MHGETVATVSSNGGRQAASRVSIQHSPDVNGFLFFFADSGEASSGVTCADAHGAGWFLGTL